jgi:prepilin-type N-terminal cleavage/methylation domain-containing protein
VTQAKKEWKLMTRKLQAGFTLIEMMISLIVLLAVSAIVMSGMVQMMKTQGTIANRTELHTSVRSATELLQQEIGQAGKISLPPPGPGLPWVMITPVNVPFSAPVTATVTFGPGNIPLFEGEWVTVDTGLNREAVQLTCLAGKGNCPFTSNSWQATFFNSHATLAPIRVQGGFSTGIVPPAPGVMTTPPPGYGGYPNGSTGTVLKLYGDINSDGNMVYVEYTCVPGNAAAPGFLYRNQMPFDSAVKPPIDPSMALLSNILTNPPDATGAAVPCFTYQVKTLNGVNAVNNDMVFVTDVAVTLTEQTQLTDPQTNQFQVETKALLNVSPRNVFNAWELASLDYTNHVQLTPTVTKTNLFP